MSSRPPLVFARAARAGFSLLAGAVLFGIASGSSDPLLAQIASEHIDGFGGFTWGTPYDSIVARLGTPARDQQLAEGIRVLVYRDTSEAPDGLELFAILDTLGLVKGQRAIPFGAGEDCQALYRRIRQRIKLRFPLLVPKETSRNDSGGDFCEGVAAGTAGWFTRWDDETSGARATVLIEPGQRRIDVVYESRAFLDWVAALEAKGSEADSTG